jgi:hypothetical protein
VNVLQCFATCCIELQLLKKKLHVSLYATLYALRIAGMLQAYVRDPNELFVQPQGGLAKKFHNVSFITDPAVMMHTVCVDWHNNIAKVYADASDVMNNVLARQMELPYRSMEREATAEEYVRETFEFLRRGHSLHHPSCHCLCKWRKNTEEYCSVGTTGQGRSIKDVERELGVRSLYGLVRAGGETLPLIQALVRFAGMTLYNNDISSPLCCVPPEIKTAKDILSAARALYPRPYIAMETCMGDLARLEAKGLVRLITLSENQYAVFWRDGCQQKAVDADIQKLWDQGARRVGDNTLRSARPSTTKTSISAPAKKKKKIHLVKCA